MCDKLGTDQVNNAGELNQHYYHQVATTDCRAECRAIADCGAAVCPFSPCQYQQYYYQQQSLHTQAAGDTIEGSFAQNNRTAMLDNGGACQAIPTQHHHNSLPPFQSLRPQQSPIEEEERPRRRRTLYSKWQQHVLEEAFAKCQYLNFAEREKIAVALELTEKRVKDWFKNKRCRIKQRQKGKTSLWWPHARSEAGEISSWTQPDHATWVASDPSNPQFLPPVTLGHHYLHPVPHESLDPLSLGACIGGSSHQIAITPTTTTTTAEQNQLGSELNS